MAREEVFVTLRRLGAADASAGGGTYPAEDGRLSTAYNLYESKEVVLLLADPRARTSYILQELEGEVTADEESQCRRCTRPAYLQRLIDDGLLQADDIRELLAAGPYVRATLSTERTDPLDTSVAVPADSGATAQARVFFRGNSAGYRAPWGLARATSWADSVPAPIQVSLEEPVLSPAYWDSGERGVGVLLGGGEAFLSATDYAKPGRGIDVALERTYRSGVLGFGPLGSAGWSSPLLQHLRPIPLYGDGKRPSRQGPVSLEELTDIPEMVEYYDGAGHVFRFVSKGKGGCPAWAEEDSLGSYCVPKGLYLRLRKLEGGRGGSSWDGSRASFSLTSTVDSWRFETVTVSTPTILTLEAIRINSSTTPSAPSPRWRTTTGASITSRSSATRGRTASSTAS